jgi:hypothetical protein
MIYFVHRQLLQNSNISDSFTALLITFPNSLVNLFQSQRRESFLEETQADTFVDSKDIHNVRK